MYKNKIRATRILLIFILALLVVVLYGKLRVYKDVDLNKIGNTLLSKNKTAENFIKGDDKSLKRYYGLNEKDYDEVLYYKPKSNMDVDEVLVVKVNNKSQIDFIEDSMNSRIKSQENTFRDYAPEQYSIVKNNEMMIKGNYVFLAISKDAEKIKERFIDSIE